MWICNAVVWSYFGKPENANLQIYYETLQSNDTRFLRKIPCIYSDNFFLFYFFFFCISLFNIKSLANNLIIKGAFNNPNQKSSNNNQVHHQLMWLWKICWTSLLKNDRPFFCLKCLFHSTMTVKHVYKTLKETWKWGLYEPLFFRYGLKLLALFINGENETSLYSDLLYRCALKTGLTVD